MSAILKRMSLIDPLNEARQQCGVKSKQDEGSHQDKLGWKSTMVDSNHVMRVVKLILRTGAFSLSPCLIPYNMYAKEKTALPMSILDINSLPAAKHLLERFLVKESLCGYTEQDVTNTSSET